MSIKAATASAAHLNTIGDAIQVSATYEVTLSGVDLNALSSMAGPDGIPGLIVAALADYAACRGRKCRWTGAGCMTSQELQLAAYHQDQERQSRARSER